VKLQGRGTCRRWAAPVEEDRAHRQSALRGMGEAYHRKSWPSVATELSGIRTDRLTSPSPAGRGLGWTFAMRVISTRSWPAVCCLRDQDAGGAVEGPRGSPTPHDCPSFSGQEAGQRPLLSVATSLDAGAFAKTWDASAMPRQSQRSHRGAPTVVRSPLGPRARPLDLADDLLEQVLERDDALRGSRVFVEHTNGHWRDHLSRWKRPQLVVNVSRSRGTISGGHLQALPSSGFDESSRSWRTNSSFRVG
jgi:hypothetical protein